MMLAMATIITCYSVHLFFMLFVTLTRVLFGLMCTVLSYTYLIVFVAPHVIRTRRGWYLHRKIGQRVSLWRASSVVIQGRRYKQVRYQKQPTSITIGFLAGKFNFLFAIFILFVLLCKAPLWQRNPGPEGVPFKGTSEVTMSARQIGSSLAPQNLFTIAPPQDSFRDTVTTNLPQWWSPDQLYHVYRTWMILVESLHVFLLDRKQAHGYLCCPGFGLGFMGYLMLVQRVRAPALMTVLQAIMTSITKVHIWHGLILLPVAGAASTTMPPPTTTWTFLPLLQVATLSFTITIGTMGVIYLMWVGCRRVHQTPAPTPSPPTPLPMPPVAAASFAGAGSAELGQQVQQLREIVETLSRQPAVPHPAPPPALPPLPRSPVAARKTVRGVVPRFDTPLDDKGKQEWDEDTEDSTEAPLDRTVHFQEGMVEHEGTPRSPMHTPRTGKIPIGFATPSITGEKDAYVEGRDQRLSKADMEYEKQQRQREVDLKKHIETALGQQKLGKQGSTAFSTINFFITFMQASQLWHQSHQLGNNTSRWDREFKALLALTASSNGNEIQAYVLQKRPTQISDIIRWYLSNFSLITGRADWMKLVHKFRPMKGESVKLFMQRFLMVLHVSRIFPLEGKLDDMLVVALQEYLLLVTFTTYAGLFAYLDFSLRSARQAAQMTHDQLKLQGASGDDSDHDDQNNPDLPWGTWTEFVWWLYKYQEETEPARRKYADQQQRLFPTVETMRLQSLHFSDKSADELRSYLVTEGSDGTSYVATGFSTYFGATDTSGNSSTTQARKAKGSKPMPKFAPKDAEPPTVEPQKELCWGCLRPSKDCRSRQGCSYDHKDSKWWNVLFAYIDHPTVMTAGCANHTAFLGRIESPEQRKLLKQYLRDHPEFKATHYPTMFGVSQQGHTATTEPVADMDNSDTSPGAAGPGGSPSDFQ